MSSNNCAFVKMINNMLKTNLTKTPVLLLRPLNLAGMEKPNDLAEPLKKKSQTYQFIVLVSHNLDRFVIKIMFCKVLRVVI